MEWQHEPDGAGTMSRRLLVEFRRALLIALKAIDEELKDMTQQAA